MGFAFWDLLKEIAPSIIYICRVVITQEHINIFLSKCASSNWAGVFFSRPFETGFQFWMQDLHESNNSATEKFIFVPFDQTVSPALVLCPDKKNEEAIKDLGSRSSAGDFWKNEKLFHLHATTPNEYHQHFEKYMINISGGICQKAILSTIIKEKLAEDLDIGEYVLKLRKEYPQAFVYVFSAPFAGTWIGATPETLLKWDQNQVSTMSLAGTKRSGEATFNFGDKEKKEQDIVTGYIAEIFKARFSQVEWKEREELIYGEMTHLLSRVNGWANSSFTGNEFLELARELHPTPAVGGYPVDPALDLIRSTETHPRLYYSGFLGIVDKTSGELVVNLRCMSLADGNCYTFAGGGITADSNEQAEWAETRLKANALLKFLQ